MNGQHLPTKRIAGFLVLTGVLWLGACARRATDVPTAALPTATLSTEAALATWVASAYPMVVTPNPATIEAHATWVASAYPGFGDTPAFSPFPTLNTSLTPIATGTPASTTEAVPTPTPVPPPTLIPTIDPGVLPDLLNAALTLQTVEGVNGHTLKRVTGWESGFRSSNYCVEGPYRWLDDGHLMVLPIVGQEEGLGITEYTLPVVANLGTGDFWLPPIARIPLGCNVPRWSEPLQTLVATTGQEVILFTPDGGMVNRFEGGSQIGVSYLSPSGLRLLTGAIWRDLATGQVVDFGARHEFDPYDTPLPNPAWSSDETRLFSCCFQYADVGTGEYVEFSLTPVDLPGRDGPGPGSPGLSSWWVLGDTRALTGIDLYDYSTVTLYPIIPVIDPLTRAYSDLGAITSLRTNPICPFIDISVAPDRAHVVIRCEQMQVIDLRTLTAQPIITGHDFVSWSPDGQYALFTKGQGMRWHEPVRNGEFALWPLIEGDAYLITDRVIRTPVWNPHGKWLAYFSDDGKTLITLEAATRASRVVLLPQPFVSAVWSLQGDMLAVIAEDGSVWAASPALGQAQQLTPPLPNVRDVRWSPSGNQLAFVSGADVYVVSVTVGMAQPNYPALWQVVGMFMLVYAPAYWWAGARPRR